MDDVTAVYLRSGAYYDSVSLMQVSRTVADTAGVLAAQVAMATELNIEVLTTMGFAHHCRHPLKAMRPRFHARCHDHLRH